VEDKTIIGVTAIICVTIIQAIAWYMGHDGAVFALTSAIIGGVVGFFLGIKINVKGSIAEFVDQKTLK